MRATIRLTSLTLGLGLLASSCGQGAPPCILDTDCPQGFVCDQGVCVEPDPCDGRVCDQPPAAECADTSNLRVYAAPGRCEAGACGYPSTLVPCPEGCAAGVCQGCQADCAGKACGGDGCGGSCGSCPAGSSCDGAGQCQPDCACGPGEACVLGRCGPLAFLLGADGNTPSGVCPPGYQLAGRWRTGPGAVDGQAEGRDSHDHPVDGGFMWLCSTDPARARVIAGVSDCGGPVSACAGELRGHWHVGSGCAGQTAGVDADGVALTAGWMRLCAAPGTPIFAEPGGHDCGPAGPGCGQTRRLGAWHTHPIACGQGDTGVGASGASIQTGWMELCLDTPSWPPVDADGLEGKALAGYQGWFVAPGDGSAWNTWIHWFQGGVPDAAHATFDLWPDLREYPPDELFPTTMTYPDGGAVGLFSSHHPRTVERHFRWMAEHGLDGVFLQRFLHEAVLPVPGAVRDQVARHVLAAAEAHGRVFAIEYDISGSTDDMLPQALIDDWKHLVDDLGLTRSDRYLRHRGLPLVGVWGIGFDDRAGTPEDIQALVDFFHGAPEERYRATVLGGVPEGWRTSSGSSRPGFGAAYRLYDVINPWLVGRYADEAGVAAFDRDFIEPDLAECRALGKDYMPVLFPGFSWANLTGDPATFNVIPRLGGRFYWRQFHEFLSSGCRMLFLAMFDEVDEATAILKAAPDASHLPVQGRFLTLDADGLSLPSDWYLRLAGVGTKVLQGVRPSSASLPLR
jgi:hypothetical protein